MHLLRIVGMLHPVVGVGAGRSLHGARSAWPYCQFQRRATRSCGTPIGPRWASIHSSDPAATGFSTYHPFKRGSVPPRLFSEHPNSGQSRLPHRATHSLIEASQASKYVRVPTMVTVPAEPRIRVS